MVVTNEMIEAGNDAAVFASKSEVKEILTAALAVAPGVKVNPLEWEYKERSVGTYIAKDDRGDMYWINQSFGSDSYYFTTIRRADEETLYDADDLDAAKSAAQADYTARIMSALATTETGGHE